MKYLARFQEIEKIEIPENYHRQNRQNPLAATKTVPTVPPALQEMPDLEFCDSGPMLGLWLWHGWVVPTAATMTAYRRYCRLRLINKNSK